MEPSARYVESYEGSRVPLQRNGWVNVWFKKYAYAATGSQASTTPHRYHACVSVYWKRRARSRSLSSAWGCGEPEVASYALDPALQIMRLRLTMRCGYGPITVDLTMHGKGTPHTPPPSTGERTYAPVVTQWSSRRAVATGHVWTPRMGTRRIRGHHARRGVLERGVDLYRWSSRYPYHRHPS